MVGQNPAWADLTQELLSTIANYVYLTSDPISVLSFRSVCRSWRSSCPNNSPILSPLLPLSCLSALVSFDSCSPCFLSTTIIYALRRPLGFSSLSLSPDSWILLVDEFIPGKLSIRKPFISGSYHIPMNFPNNMNLLDYNVRELGRFHNLSYSSYCDTLYGCCKRSQPRFYDLSEVNKVVIFPNASGVITLGKDGTLRMYRLDNDGVIKGYETKHDGKTFMFDDIVEYKGRVLGIDRTGSIYEINYHTSSQMTPFVAPPPIDDVDGDGDGDGDGGGRRKRLVESLGHLYLVVRWKRREFLLYRELKKTKFKVYELNENEQKWIEITSLNDRFFSFGRTYSFSASATELGSSVQNCILFTGLSFSCYLTDSVHGYEKFPNLKSGNLDIGVYKLHDTDDFGAIDSYPGYSDTFWPPPCWIWSIDRLKRIQIVETAMDEILDKIPENFKVESCDDEYGKLAVLKYVKVILKLKKMAIKFQEEEVELNNQLEDSMDIVNQVLAHKRNAYLLNMEEEATQLELSMKSQIATLLRDTNAKLIVSTGYLASYFRLLHDYRLTFTK
ncbi:hypothetical protein KSS87_008403 [Heliosperma pusillum]|nr:hypothetical protein KSS87_008403 [Heliosperma pusillum]